MTASALLVEPAYLSIPPYARTLGPEVADLARLVDFGPDPEQELALDALFAFDSRDLSTAFELALICCRQNMKTGTFKQAALGWLFLTDQRLVVWSAHEFATAQEAFRDMDQLVTGSDYLRRRVKAIYRGNGDESIELLSGARLIFKTRTKGGGRGLTGDKVILDEAFALQPMHMGALLPTLSARPDPQVVYGSSAGLADSEVLRAIRDRGRPGGDPKLAYLEWCAPEDCAAESCDHKLGSTGCAMDDPQNWARANPIVDRPPRGNGTGITSEYIAAERRAMPVHEFGRERLGWWDEPLVGEIAITPSKWATLREPGSQIVGRVAFSIDMAPDHDSVAIGVCGLNGKGLSHVEVVDYRPGVDWAVARAVEVCGKAGIRKIALDAAGPVATLIQALEAAGLQVEKLNARDVTAACGGLYEDAIADPPRLVHIGQPVLDVAVAGGVKQTSGDVWRWSRKLPTVDICPLYAVTLARYAFALDPPKPVFVY